MFAIMRQLKSKTDEFVSADGEKILDPTTEKELSISISRGPVLKVVVDNVVMCSTKSFLDSLAAFVACFWVLDARYPKPMSKLLQFVQRCLLGLKDPDPKIKLNKSAINVVYKLGIKHV